jgi:hypothetical protein
MRAFVGFGHPARPPRHAARSVGLGKPGFGRTPVPTPCEKFIEAWESWADAGAPCP